MPLAPGTRIGGYEILSAIGAGGMGEVYRARDTKLNRDVALKILPPAFTSDPDRLARFKREAQVLASLNHPNIGHIYGFEDSGAAHALVLELVHGEDLAAHIARGALPLEEALRIARQMIDALEAAHEQGIVHRDLKPANVKVRDDGTVKILDFGLAKALAPAGASATADEMNSPTMTAVLGTEMGMILGTAAYMSPEQARGRAIDKRTDVWAFGCVLYEMLSGKRAFDGEDATEMIAAVVKSDPDWTALPSTIPAHVRMILIRCLAKDRKTRIPDLSVVRFALDDAMSVVAPSPVGAPSPRGGELAWRVTAGILALTTIAASVAWYRARLTVPPDDVTRFVVEAPPNGEFSVQGGRHAAVGVISPDGKWLAFTASDQSDVRRHLWLRPIDGIAAHVLAGADGAVFPFWSPDSKFIGFSTGDSKLVKMAIAGGPMQPLCSLFPGITARGASWNRDGVIIFNNGPRALYKVSDQGGTPERLRAMDPKEGGQDFPSFLPDGKHFLYDSGGMSKNIYVGSLDGSEPKPVITADTGAVYAANGGYLLFGRGGTLMAQKFDLATFTVQGDPIRVAENLETSAVAGLVAFSVSDTGVLAYGTGDSLDTGFDLVWVDRAGTVIGKAGSSSAKYLGIDLSPDGSLIATHRHDDPLNRTSGDIWISEVAGARSWSRFTTDASQENASPVFSRDSKRVAFASIRNGKSGIYMRAVGSVGDDEKLIEFDSTGFMGPVPMSWSPDGQKILFGMQSESTGRDLWWLPLTGDRKPLPFARTTFAEGFGSVSPDGQWVAFASNDTGKPEIYVQRTEGTEARRMISVDGGGRPRWRGDGKELFYLSLVKNTLMAVGFTSTGTTFQAAPPVALFDSALPAASHVVDFYPYAVSKDGQRFLVTRRPGDVQPNPIVVVLNWTEGLKK